jgi:hypothetical protein
MILFLHVGSPTQLRIAYRFEPAMGFLSIGKGYRNFSAVASKAIHGEKHRLGRSEDPIVEYVRAILRPIDQQYFDGRCSPGLSGFAITLRDFIAVAFGVHVELLLDGIVISIQN